MSRSSPPTEIFRERLLAARKMRVLSQSELAEKAGLQPAAVSHFETGARKPSFDNLRNLAEALQVTTDYLIGRTPDPETVWKPDDPLYRHVEQLSDADREHAAEYLELLVKRAEKKERVRRRE